MKQATWTWKVDPTTKQGIACKLWDTEREVFKAHDGEEYSRGHKFEGQVEIKTFATVAETTEHYGEEVCLKSIEHALIQTALNEARQGHQAKLGWTSKPEGKLEAFMLRVAECEGIDIEKLREIASSK